MTDERRRPEDGWIEWAGGDCPFNKRTLLDVLDRDGHVWHEQYTHPVGDEDIAAAKCFWNHKRHGEFMETYFSCNDIIAYRVVSA